MKELNKHIHSLRKDYDRHSLEEKNVSPSPFVQFSDWMQTALEENVPEPNAIVLSTVSAQSRPSSRVVLLREFSEEGFVFYTNYHSRKGDDISANPFVSITIFWPQLERQVRIEGKAEKISEERSNAYFHSRPLESKVGAWASLQSKVLRSREHLEQLMQELIDQYRGKEVPRPLHWGGYILKPDYFEFWQGRSSRLHDRITYRLEEDNWIIQRLFP